MRNKIDFTLPPDALFLNPWRDPGLRLLQTPDPMWRSLPKTTVRGFPASGDPALNQQMRRSLREIERARAFDAAVLYNSLPVLVEDAHFLKSFLLAGDKLVLSGAMAARATNQFRLDSRKAGVEGGPLLDAFFDSCQTANRGQLLPLSDTFPEGLPFAVACRNTFNYFHFITEALCQLCVLDDLDFPGEIFFHFPNPEDRQRSFTRAFAEALFPEFRGRMHFERAPKSYPAVLTAFDLSGAQYQAPEADTAGIAELAPPDLVGEGPIRAEHHRALAANALNLSLLRLRERALAAIEVRDTAHLPRRFFFGRDVRYSRQRHMAGEDALFEHLALFGFEYVVFENLDPLDQIALVANAEMMVSYHGAGFTNMLFANPDTVAIEIGTVETLKTRWGDFAPLAHASGCRYFTFFADISEADRDSAEARDTGGLLPGALSLEATADILAFVVTLLGQYPDLPAPRPLATLVERLLAAGEPEKALTLLDRHEALLDGQAALWTLKADCYKALGQPKPELAALDRAYKLDPRQWQTLVRMVWCARRCDRPQVIRWALSRLKADFPERHATFVGNHDWLRYVA